jgi:Arm DNA-binding domain
MARINLTDAKIRALKPAQPGSRFEVLDALVPGLIVRVSDKGKHSLMLKTRFPHSPHPVRRLIGEHGTLTIDAARQVAREWYALIRKGIDPADEL